jgi:ABC-type Fe3+/spermidine/putrescine transport system ATPase subunit
MLRVVDIVKSYEGQPLLSGISLAVEAGETACLLGPSGSGKSTLLRIIAGLESPEAGQILWDDIDLASTPPHLRDFGLVFQDYALFPHLDVFDNVGFGLKMRNTTKSRSHKDAKKNKSFVPLSLGDFVAISEVEIQKRVSEVLDLVNLEGFEHRKVTDLSGGEQQRVALARALAPNPRLLMFDEPLGALDRTLKEELLDELRRILHHTHVPAIYVTHDQEEAFAVGDRILILHEGRIICEGSPQQIVARPCSAWTAQFLGLGNVIKGIIVDNQVIKTEFGTFTVSCPENNQKGENVDLLVHSQDVGEETNVIQGRVTDALFQKEGYKVTLENGLSFQLKDAPKVGNIISVRVSVECLPRSGS